MTCTITLNTVREIREETKKTPTVLEAVELDRWLTDGGSIENEGARDAPKPLLTAQKFRDYTWYQPGSIRKNLPSTVLKQYRPSANDISRHNPHV